MSDDDIPGMLGIAIGVASQRWPHTMDAAVWTTEWLEHLKRHPSIATDEGTMIGWFANAIMAGYDTANQRHGNEVERLRAHITAIHAEDRERVAILTAHRPCHASEHNPDQGRIHGYCVVCGVPWPCEYVGVPAPLHKVIEETP